MSVIPNSSIQVYSDQMQLIRQYVVFFLFRLLDPAHFIWSSLYWRSSLVSYAKGRVAPITLPRFEICNNGFDQ